ncbi:MAG: ABC transporter ATP-binding protein [Spirochaetales bacterium]|nr:ABC transporter ATP-binding protein [Spirochaetales bacterium]
MENIVEVKNLVKSYGDIRALEGIDFYVRRGEIFGLLGPNGAGKTTTISILTGLSRPGGGSVTCCGMDAAGRMKKIQARVGIVPDESNLYDELTGFENLCFCGALYGVRKKARERKARELIEYLGMGEFARRRYKSYSKGIKRKLTVAAALVHEPELLFLDEPTTGIDVASARTIREMIKELNARGTTVFLTTHYIEEAERLCGRIAFITRGRIVRAATIGELLAGAGNESIIEIALGAPPADREALADDIKKILPEAVVSFPEKLTVRLQAGRDVDLGRPIALFAARGVRVREARLVKKSLEDVFVKVTGVEADAMKGEKEKK